LKAHASAVIRQTPSKIYSLVLGILFRFVRPKWDLKGILSFEAVGLGICKFFAYAQPGQQRI
jgi:hypothetical protein